MICELLACLMACVAYSGHVVKGMENGMLILGLILAVCVLLVFIVTLPKFLTIIEFNNQEIIVKTPFKTKTKISYSSYKYMFLAYYRQGKQHGLSYFRLFLVVSQKWISNAELTHINTVENNEQTIKIKLSKNRCKKLFHIFPKHQKEILKKLVQEKLPNYREILDE